MEGSPVCIQAEHGMQIAEAIARRGIRKGYYLERRGDVLLRNKEVFKLWKRLGLNTMFLGLPSLSETNFTFTRAADDADARSIIIPKNSSMRRAWAPRFSAFRLLLIGNWRDRLFTNAIRVADWCDRRCSQS